MAVFHDKVRSLSTISEVTNYYRSRNIPTSLCHGNFDLMHIGHLELFRAAKRKAGILIVGVDSDADITARRAKPIIGERDRSKLLSAYELIDFVFINDSKTRNFSEEWMKIYKKVQPNYIATCWAKDKYAQRKQEEAKELAPLGIKFISGGRVLESSLDIISRIVQRYCK